MQPTGLASSARTSLPGMDCIPGRLALGDPIFRAGLPTLLAGLLILLAPRCLQPLAAAMRTARTQRLHQAAAPAAQLHAGSSSPGLSTAFAAPVLAWSDRILEWSDVYQLDPNLIATVIQIESCGDPTAVSPAGAMGLFQVMPFHFGDMENPFDPEANARRGLMYLSSCLVRAEGDVARALAAYNGGPSVLALPTDDWPAETRRYVLWGSAILREVASGSGFSPTLQQWLAAGGERLCRNASGQRSSSPATPRP